MSKKKILVLTRARDTCFYYRIINPHRFLDSERWESRFELSHIGRMQSLETDQQYRAREQKYLEEVKIWIEESDLVIIQRGTDQLQLDMVLHAKKVGVPVIYEADDDYLHVPPENPGYIYFGNRQVPIRKMLKEVDLITVSTNELKKAYSGLNDDIHVLPNSIDFETFDATEPKTDFKEIVDAAQMPTKLVDDIKMGRLGPAPKEVLQYKVDYNHYRERTKDKIIMLWSGSPTHVVDIQQTVAAVVRQTQTNGDLAFVIGGYVVTQWFSRCHRRDMFLIGLVPMKHYYGIYKAINADITLAPVAPNQFNRCKSNLRVIEAMAMRSFPVATDFVTYNETIHKGWLAKWTAQSWDEKLSKAIKMQRRGELANWIDENEQYVRERFDQRKNAQLWGEVYEYAISKTKAESGRSDRRMPVG